MNGVPWILAYGVPVLLVGSIAGGAVVLGMLIAKAIKERKEKGAGKPGEES